MFQESEINLARQNNINDKKHDASSGSDTINGVHHSFDPLPKKNYSHPAFYQLLVTLHVQTSFRIIIIRIIMFPADDRH